MNLRTKFPGAMRQAIGPVRDFVKRRLWPDAKATRERYFWLNGFYPDLRDPKDLSEKVSWLKLHDRSPLHTLCADKIAARDYVATQAGTGPLVPLLHVLDRAEQVTPEAIPEERFVVKTNHDQGGVFLCQDRAAFDWAAARGQIAARMGRNKYPEFREWQYRDIRPRILVEALVEGEGGGPCAQEIKVNCFHGAPGFLQVVLDRFGARRQAFFGPDWTRLPMRGRADPLEGDLAPPPDLDGLLAEAAALAAPFPFVRIDFLIGAGGRRWFSEVTFHPAAGFVRYRPPAMERAWGERIDLSRMPEARRLQTEALAQVRAWRDRPA